MKAIIPVAGIGSRLRPHTHTQPKSLIPVAGKPILAHIVDQLVEWGIEEFVFVIGYLGDKIEHYITQQYPEIKCYFVVQGEGKGTAHALWLSRDLFDDDKPLLIVFGDTIFKADKTRFIDNPYSCVGVKKVDDPSTFGVAELNEDKTVSRVVEKPRIPKSNLALVGVYKIANVSLLKQALDHVLNHEAHPSGEFHLTDALMYMIDHGERIETCEVERWFDCGRKDILLETNAILLKLGQYRRHSSDQLENSIIIPPVYLGEGVELIDSIVGPNVSIGDFTVVESSIVRNTIIGSHSRLHAASLNQSVVGNDSSLTGARLSLNLGDSTEINMG
jgi:glucose-1-phosphate thymidylyltransferase